MSAPQEILSGQIVLVGYGRVGRRIAAALDEAGVAYIVTEENREAVDERAGAASTRWPGMPRRPKCWSRRMSRTRRCW